MSRPSFVRSGVWRHLKRAGGHLWLALGHVAAAAVALLGQLLAGLLAIIVVFEEWGWKPLAAALARLGRLRPFALLEAWIAGLPPYGALAVFGLPSLLLLPLKLLSFWLIAQGYALAAACLFIGAKVVGTALVARIFMLTQPALMRIGWFARLYHWAMPIKTALVEWVRASWAWRVGRILKARVVRRIAPLIVAIKARLARLFGRSPPSAG
jgi:hypothetical protein